jgi:uncharacterized protein involved in tellurium resistance
VISDPRFAPRRSDLPYLRRRRRPKQADEPAVAATPPKISFDRPGAASRSRGEAPPSTISFDRPGRATPPRVETPPPVPPPRPAPPQPPAPPTPVSTSLDLDEPAPAASPVPPRQAPRAARDEPPRRARDDVRVAAGRRVILTVSVPTVTLTRLQSAIGTLRFEAAVSSEVGDLQLGCAYRLRSGLSSVLQPDGDHRVAPPGSRRPVLVAGRDDGFGTVEVDLRQSRDLDRLVLYAFSASRAPLRWGGTLVVETFGKARIELPLESLQGGDVAVLMSLYNVRGEFVLRAEMQTLNGDVREACRAYGYDRITWLDSRTPVD